MNFEAWQEDMVRLAICYRILELGEKISTNEDDHNSDIMFIGKFLDKMSNEGYIEDTAVDGFWEVTPKGQEVIQRSVKAIAAMEPFEILSGYNLTLELTPEEKREGDEFQIHDDLYDPRFAAPDEALTEDHVDLRLAIVQYLSEHQKEQAVSVDPKRVVFIRNMVNGVFDQEDFWYNLRSGMYFNDVTEIVDTAYRWTDLHDDVEEAKWLMEQIYKAAMSENIKRKGEECVECGAPLGMFEFIAEKERTPLKECPVCNTSFLEPEEPEEEEYEEVVTTTTTTTEETVEDGYYDDGYGYGCDYYGYGGMYCEPVYYYDPYAMYATDVLLTACLIDAIF